MICDDTLDVFKSSIIIIAVIAVLPRTEAAAQDAGLYYKNFVRHADGSFCEHDGNEAAFIAYLNRDSSRVLFENAARWEADADPNIAGNGTFGVQLDNFQAPAPSDGDSVHVQFTCLVEDEQGVLGDRIKRPWNELPQTLHLSASDFPERPENVELSINGDERGLNWSTADDTRYLVYRRSSSDTLSSGEARMVYHRVAEVDEAPFVDTTAGEGAFGYVVVPISGNRIGPRSPEATDIPVPPAIVNAAQSEVEPAAVEISWSRSGNVLGAHFAVYRSTSEGAGYELIAEVDTTSYNDLNVQAPGTYWYRIRTIGAGGGRSEASDASAVHVRTPLVNEGYRAGVYADAGLEHPSGMVWGPDGKLYVSEVSSGEIKIVHDHDSDRRADEVTVFADGFTMPVGLAWQGDSLYVSSRGKITILRDDDRDGIADFSDTIISGWEAHWHQNNQLVFDEDGYFYVALGAWEDRTTGPSPYHNKILRISPDGSSIQIWAEGIRNVYDLTFGPDGNLYGGDNGWQDGSEGPPVEELNVYMEGEDYGFPDYLGPAPPESGTVDPIMTYPPHTSPTGVLFLSGPNIPEDHRNDLLLAFYGPDYWLPAVTDRAYRIIRNEMDGTTVTDTSSFASGFYRPVDMVQDSAGTLYVADLGDLGVDAIDGRIYTITYQDATSSESPPAHPTPDKNLFAYPNPFDDDAVIEFHLSEQSYVDLEVYDILGRRVRSLLGGVLDPGRHEVRWNGMSDGGRQVAAGLYVLRLRTNEFVITGVLVRAQ